MQTKQSLSLFSDYNTSILIADQLTNANLSNMKFLLSLALLGVFCPENATSYITSLSPGGATPPWTTKTYKQPPTNIEVDDVFREEYKTWAKLYGKETNDFRFENFKLNYMLQMQHNKKTGTFSDLNEFGDCKLLICIRNRW